MTFSIKPKHEEHKETSRKMRKEGTPFHISINICRIFFLYMLKNLQLFKFYCKFNDHVKCIILIICNKFSL